VHGRRWSTWRWFSLSQHSSGCLSRRRRTVQGGCSAQLSLSGPARHHHTTAKHRVISLCDDYKSKSRPGRSRLVAATTAVNLTPASVRLSRFDWAWKILLLHALASAHRPSQNASRQRPPILHGVYSLLACGAKRRRNKAAACVRGVSVYTTSSLTYSHTTLDEHARTLVAPDVDQRISQTDRSAVVVRSGRLYIRFMRRIISAPR